MVFDYGKADVERTTREAQLWQFKQIRSRLQREGQDTNEKLTKIKEFYDKQEKENKKKLEKLSKLYSKLKKEPKFLKKRMKYRTSNPLKKLLSKKRPTIKVGGY